MTDDAPSPDQFRRALGAYPTGVTVVTAIGANGPSGATANAVTSLSLDPPMMLACLDRGSRT
ncbi:MAG: flavin reductase, partial [Actinomycetota bacterium]|nr:flavin reductase [Actinomycetota bacterium]